MKTLDKEVFPSSLYLFLRHIESEFTNKKILDCGAGGPFPNIALFKKLGFDVYGIEISEDSIKKTEKFAEEYDIELNIQKGDMRKIPFRDNFFHFMYSYNSIFHLSKADSGIAIDEMFRVLKKGGLLFVNFLSVEDSLYKSGEEVNPGEFLQ